MQFIKPLQKNSALDGNLHFSEKCFLRRGCIRPGGAEKAKFRSGRTSAAPQPHTDFRGLDGTQAVSSAGLYPRFRPAPHASSEYIKLANDCIFADLYLEIAQSEPECFVNLYDFCAFYLVFRFNLLTLSALSAIINYKEVVPITVTIKDIANLCGVSYSTVSRVLNSKNVRQSERNDRILATARALNYKPNHVAMQLVKKQTNVIGLIIPDISNPHYPEITKSVEDSATAAGYQVLLCNTDWDVTKEERCRDALVAKRVAGMIVMPVCDESHSIFRGLDIPVAFLGTRTEEPGIDYVVMDNIKAAFDATVHLIRHGHTRLAYIGRKMMNYTSFDRAEGFRLATRQHRIPDADAKIVLSESFQMKGGYFAMQALLRQPDPPTGILAFNDFLAFGAMQAAEEAGLHVGSDLSIIGFDDILFSALPKINLTTMTPSKADLGEQTLRCILRRLQTPDMPRQTVILPSQMIERST